MDDFPSDQQTDKPNIQYLSWFIIICLLIQRRNNPSEQCILTFETQHRENFDFPPSSISSSSSSLQYVEQND